MKIMLSYFVWILIGMGTFTASCDKKKDKLVVKEDPDDTNGQDENEPTDNVKKHLDFEDATVSGTSNTETLNNSGGAYIIHKYGEALLPQLSTRSSKGSKGLKCSSPTNNMGVYARSEIGIKDNVPFNTVRAYAFDVYFDEDFPSGGPGANASNWLIFSQFWQYAPGMPIITLEVKHGSDLEYQLVVRNDDTGSVVSTAPYPWPVRGYGSLERGVWIRFALEVKIDPYEEGYVRLYKNGTLEHTYRGKIGYSQAVVTRQNADWRCGLYRTGAYHWQATTLWFDEIKYGYTLNEVL